MNASPNVRTPPCGPLASLTGCLTNKSPPSSTVATIAVPPSRRSTFGAGTTMTSCQGFHSPRTSTSAPKSTWTDCECYRKGWRVRLIRLFHPYLTTLIGTLAFGDTFFSALQINYWVQKKNRRANSSPNCVRV